MSADVVFIVKTDNLHLLKTHVNKSEIHQSLQGAKNLDVGFKKLIQLDSVMNSLEIPFEYYNNKKYYCMIESNGHSYIVMESPYQLDLKKFAEYFKVDLSDKENKHVYPFQSSTYLFVKGRFAIFSDQPEFLANVEKFERNEQVEALNETFVSDSYCQVFQKKEEWSVFDLVIEPQFVQMPSHEKGKAYDTYGAFEDPEIFYFVLKDVESLEWIKSKSPFLETQKIFNNEVKLDPELTSWVKGSIVKFENQFGSYLLIRASDDVAPSAQLESATIMNLNVDMDSLEQFKVNEHVIFQFDPKMNYNELFGSATKYKWYAEISSYVIFADSKTAMTNYFANFDAGELINFDPDFSEFVRSFPSKANYFKLTKKIKDFDYPGSVDPEKLIMGESVLISDGMTFRNKGYLVTGDIVKQVEGVSVLAEFEKPFEIDKFIHVKDHIDGNHGYFLASTKGDVVFVNHEGTQKWKAKIDGRILGEPKVVDLFGNNKKQILFNTESKLYLLDIKGNNVAQFPFVIPGKASNSVSVLDYDKNNNYRFLIATQDNKLLNIGEDGLAVPGWEFTKTNGLVKGPVNHFIIDGKDYIFFSDKSNKVYMLNRRGQERIEEQIVADKQYQFFQKGKDILSTRLFSVSPQKIYTLTLDNQADSIDAEIQKPYKFIQFKDFDGDGIKEFIFISSGYVNIVNQFGLTSRQIPTPSENVSKVELIYIDGKLEKLVLFDYVKEELIMIDINGTILDGYPMSCKKYLGSFQNNKIIVNCMVDEKNVRLIQN